MKVRMLAVLFLAGITSRCVFIAHAPVTARSWPQILHAKPEAVPGFTPMISEGR